MLLALISVLALHLPQGKLIPLQANYSIAKPTDIQPAAQVNIEQTAINPQVTYSPQIASVSRTSQAAVVFSYLQ